MDQQQANSLAAVDRLRDERTNATDPAVIAALDNQIRIHSEFAGIEPELAVAEEPAAPTKSKSAKAEG